MSGMDESACYILGFRAKDPQAYTIKVSIEDYERIVAVRHTWRISSSGYAVGGKRIDGRNEVTYLHKLIFGGTCTHINGDRLDNRRTNLTATPARRKKNMEIKSLQTEPTEYPDGKQFYGRVTLENVPEGFGMLVESNKRSLGWWRDGQFHSGIVMHLAPVPSIMKDQVDVFHPVREANLILDHVCYRVP
jgi:hypothetical protein